MDSDVWTSFYSSYDYINTTILPSSESAYLHFLIPQGIVAAAGTLGNAFFCIVVLLDRKLHSQRSNILLVLMAIGNITYLISQFTFVYTSLSDTYTPTVQRCKIQYAIPAFSGALCIFALTACSIERYLGVVKYPLSSGSRKPWIFTGAAFVISILLALGLGLNAYCWSTMIFTKKCWDHDFFDAESLFKWISLGKSLLIYLLPLFIVTFCYASIIARIMQSSSLHRNQPVVRMNRSLERRKTGIVVLLVITIFFAILWLPFHVIKLLDAFESLGVLTDPVVHLCLYSAIANCVLDPVLIFMLSSDHRRAASELLFCSKHRNRRLRLATIRSTVYTSGTSVKKNYKDHIEVTTAV